MLEGWLVDLVPQGKRFDALEHEWENGESAFWSDMGDRQFFSRAVITARQEQRVERRAQQTDSGIHFGIQAKDGTPIGIFVIAGIRPHHRVAILGVSIGEPDYWGGGYGTDALLLMVDYAFNWLDMRKVWLMTMNYNARVVRQMEKVGFALEGRRREGTLVDGIWYDELVYGLLREEWLGRETMIEKVGLQAR
jgi:RimJ/RimL family protein N-acetyltransferase